MALDDRITIDTPEGVTLELVVAGLGSRFVARLLDTLIQVAIIFALLFGLAVTGLSGAALVAAFSVLTTFFVLWGYDICFETLGGGRPPGKRVAGIRVVGQHGEPVSFLSSVIRNIVRLVDFLPLGYVVGTTSMLATRHEQRLGDLAAGTYVIRERFPGQESAPLAPLSVPLETIVSWDVSAVDADDVQVLRHFLSRRLTLEWPVRSYYAVELVRRIAPKVAGIPYDVHPEFIIEGIVVAKQARA